MMDQQTPYVDEAPVTATGGFASVEFAENPEPRCACILLLDTSGSMNGPPIQQFNLGLRSFKDELLSDSLAAKRVEIAVRHLRRRARSSRATSATRPTSSRRR